MAETITLGKVSVSPKGAYSSTASYTFLDAVSHNGGAFLCLQNATGVEPGVSSGWQMYWMETSVGIAEVELSAPAEGQAQFIVTLSNGITRSLNVSTTVIADGAVTLEKINSSAYDTTPTPGSSKLVTSGGVAEELSGVAEALSGKISMIKLWENASPTSEFAAQTILQNVSSEFEFIRVFFSFSREPSFEIMRDTSRVCNNINNGDSTATMSVSTRKINFTDGVVSAEDAKYKTFPAGTPTVSNTLMVPRIIYGIKGVIE